MKLEYKTLLEKYYTAIASLLTLYYIPTYLQFLLHVLMKLRPHMAYFLCTVKEKREENQATS